MPFLFSGLYILFPQELFIAFSLQGEELTTTVSITNYLFLSPQYILWNPKALNIVSLDLKSKV